MCKTFLDVRSRFWDLQLVTPLRSRCQKASNSFGLEYCESASKWTFHHWDDKLLESVGASSQENEGRNLYWDTHVTGRKTRCSLAESDQATQIYNGPEWREQTPEKRHRLKQKDADKAEKIGRKTCCLVRSTII